MRVKSFVPAFVIATVLALSQCVHIQTVHVPEGPRAFAWVPVPLRSAAQKAKGYAGGETGQQAFTVAICPSDPEWLAIGIDTAAVYVSNDGARSWHLARDGIMSNGVQSVAFDPRNPRVLWAAGLNGGAPSPKADGIYLSTDGGGHWHRLRAAAYYRRQAQNEYFAFDPRSYDGKQHRTVYAVTHDQGLLKTTDGGSTWKPLGFASTLINAVILHPENPELLFCAADTGLYRSGDAGASFARIGGGLPASAPVLGLAADPGDASVLYAAIGIDGIWRSTDGGRTFAPRMNGIPPWAATDKWTWSRLCISAADPQRLYADAVWGGAFPYWSHDGGATWSPPTRREPGFTDDPTDPGHWMPEGFVAHPTDPDVAYHLTPVRKTTDGGRTWVYASDGVSGCRRLFRTSIAFRPDDPLKLMLFHPDWGAAFTADGGDTFTWCPAPRQELGSWYMPVGAYDPTPRSRTVISAIGGSGQESGIQRLCISRNDGRAWEVLRGTEGDYQFMAYHPQQPDVVYAGRADDSLRSRDGGQTWSKLRHAIRAMYPGNGDIVYSVRPTGQQWKWEILRSRDQGETWSPLPGTIMSTSFRDLDVDPVDPDRLYAASDFGVWVFDGTGWSVRDTRHGLATTAYGDLTYHSIAVDPTRPGVVYTGQNESWVGIAQGVFRSTDGGDNWENITLNLGPDLTVWAITVSPHDGTVWLGTDYGNWRLPPGPYEE